MGRFVNGLMEKASEGPRSRKTKTIMAKIKGTIVVDKERCKGCGVCVAACPCQVLELSVEVNSKGYPVARMANPDACTGCASCGISCPDSCITVYRQKFE